MAGNEMTFGQSAALVGGESILNFGLGLASNAIQYNQQKKLMDKQFQYQKDMWNYTFDKQNQYNLPSEQMARMKQAGLNPNLAYGQVQPAGSSGTTGSQPNATAPNMNPGQIDFTTAAQISVLKAQANQSVSASKINDAEYLNKMIQNKYLARLYKDENLEALINYELDWRKLDLEQRSLDKGYTMQKSAESVAREYNLNSSTALNILMGVTESIKPDLLLKQIQDYDSQITQRQFYCGYLSAMKGYYNSLKDLTDTEKKIKDKLNSNWEKRNSRELALMASEIYKNYSTNHSIKLPYGFGVGSTSRPGNMEKLYNDY